MVKRVLYILISGLFLLVFSACDSGLKIVEISISKYPDRISYFCGQDNEIDLTGLEITVKSADGNSYIASPADDDFYGFFLLFTMLTLIPQEYIWCTLRGQGQHASSQLKY